jgi:hypothetical protein
VARSDFKVRGYTIGQYPNPPLWAALAALLVSRLANGTVHDLAQAIFYVAFTVWGYEEAAHGVNGFRRALGVIALGLVVAALV